MKINLTEKAKAAMVEDAIKTYPHECCGFFYGDENEEISAKDYMKAEQYAEENDLSLLGVYHSHPDHPSIPSEHDLKQAVPYFSYIIISIRKKELANIQSWRLDESKFIEEQIVK
jgi:proteasome lid subunit RPN8/RPN11